VTPYWSPNSTGWPGHLPDARAIADELTARRVRVRIGGTVYDPTDPTDPVGRLLFDVLAMVAEFEADLIRLGPSPRCAELDTPGGCPSTTRRT
jgi:hypothetical protein